MKKLSVFLLALLSVVLLAACDKEKTQEQQAPTQPEVTQPEETKPNVPTQPVVPVIDTTLHLVGALKNDWSNYTDDNLMEEITAEKLAELYPDIAPKLEGKDVVRIGVKTGYEFNVGAGYEKNAVVDGEAVKLDGGYTFKVVHAAFDEEDGVSFAKQWNPGPATSHVENLTPATLFMPKWVENAAEGEAHLGQWNDDPVVIGGAGLYTVIFVEYSNVNTAETPKYAIAIIKTQELEEPKTMGELIQEEYDALKAGTTTEHTEFEFTGTVVATDLKYSEKYSNYTTNLILDVDGVLVGIYRGQLAAEDGTTYDPKTEAELKGLEEGRKVNVKGVIAETYDLTIGDVTVDIEFSKPVISWEVETYTPIHVAGVPADITAVNVFWWGSADENTWPGKAMTKNADGTWSFEKFPDGASNVIFNWTVGETTTQTVDLVHDKENNYWTLGEVVEGKYAATNDKCYFDAVTVDAAALVADLAAKAEAAEPAIELPAEYDMYVWFWGGSATGWFEAVNADGTFNVAAGTTGCCFLAVAKDVEPSWDAKIVQTGDYEIASGVATPKA